MTNTNPLIASIGCVMMAAVQGLHVHYSNCTGV